MAGECPSGGPCRARLLGPEAEEDAEAERVGQLFDGSSRLGHLDGGAGA